MRILSTAFPAVICGMLCVDAAHAGFYIPVEMPPPIIPASEQTAVKTYLVSLRQLMDDDLLNNDPSQKPTPGRISYLARIKVLKDKQTAGTILPGEMVELGGLYLRVAPATVANDREGRVEKARLVLEEAVKAVKGDKSLYFMANLNLATAYARLDLFAKARPIQEKALANWPVNGVDWLPDPLGTLDQLPYYRHAEELVLRRLKDRESGTHDTDTLRLGEVLFPAPPNHAPLSFGKGDNYLYGSLDPAMADLLPGDALVLVQQLLYWSPRDEELQWLYAELLNAFGLSAGAADWMGLLVGDGAKSQELRQHRKFLMGQRKPLASLADARSVLLNQLQETLQPNQDAGPAPVEPAKAWSSWPPDWKTLIVGFLAGLLISTLGALQVREWGRRKSNAGAQDTGTLPTPTAPPVSSGMAQPSESIHVAHGTDDRGLRS